MKRFWLSWYQSTAASDGDYRPIVSPVPGVEWWCTGSGPEDEVTLVAVVDAESEEAAWEKVSVGWPPSERRWRFCNEKPMDWQPGDRFKPSEPLRKTVEILRTKASLRERIFRLFCR